MSRARASVLLVFALSVPLSVAARAQNEKAAVLAVVRQLFDGMRAKDAAMVRGAFHPSAQLFSSSIKDGKPEVTVTTLDAFVTAVTRPRPEINDERTRNEAVQIDGGFASVWADYAFYRGTTFSHCGVDAFHLAKDASGWKIVALGDTRRTDHCEGWPK
jgi:hypothetical protein